MLKNKMLAVSRWDFYSWMLLFMVCVFQMSRWHGFPFFMDCYYHLSVMRGFCDAGGWVSKAFWEYAPYGRPHLYPPLFHILELIVFKCGVPVITIARIFDFLIYPALLFAVWRVLRSLYTKQLVFFTLFLLVSSQAIFLSVVNNIPFSIAFIFCLLSFYYFKKSKYLSSFLTLALAFYSHSLMSWLGVSALFLYSLFEGRNRKRCFLICVASVLSAIPLLLQQIRYLKFIHIARAIEFYYAEMNFILYFLAIIGIVIALKKRGSYLFFLTLAASMTALFFTNRDRFLSGQGVIPMSMLAGLTLEWAWYKYSRFKYQIFGIVIVVFYFCTPLITFSPFEKNPGFALSSYFANQFDFRGKMQSSKGETFYHSKLTQEVVSIIEQNSKDGDILFSNYTHAAGMLAVLSHRATSCGMLSEVRPFEIFDEINAARIIVWFKNENGEFPRSLASIVKKYNLKRIGETGLAYIYLNENCSFKEKILLAQVPYWVCAVLLFLVIAVIVVEHKV